MVKAVKTYRQSVPAMRFIGKRYTEADCENGVFAAKWGEAFAPGFLDTLEALLTDDFRTAYEDAEAYIGLQRWSSAMPYEYWIGMFLPADSNVPDGFASLDFEAGTLGSCWLKGPEDEIYANENLAVESFNAEGFEMIPDRSGISSLIERYGCPRFTTPDENGDVILDICSFIK